jgi:hypothetical protein
MKKYFVYVAGKYTDDTEEKIKANIEVADREAIELLKLGFIPIVPHKNSAFWDLKDKVIAEKFGLQEWLDYYCFPLQERMDMTYLCPNWKDSLGAIAEHVHAHEIRQPHSESITELCMIRAYLETRQYKEAREAHDEG